MQNEQKEKTGNFVGGFPLCPFAFAFPKVSLLFFPLFDDLKDILGETTL